MEKARQQTLFAAATELPKSGVRRLDRGDSQTLVDGVLEAVVNLSACGKAPVIEEVVADEGYHAAAASEMAEFFSFRTDIPEPKRVDALN